MKYYVIAGVLAFSMSLDAVNYLKSLAINVIVHNEDLYKKATNETQNLLPITLVNILKRGYQLAYLQKFASLKNNGMAGTAITFDPHTKKEITRADYRKNALPPGVSVIFDPHVKDRFLGLNTLEAQLFLCMLTDEVESDGQKYATIWKNMNFCNPYDTNFLPEDAQFDPYTKNRSAVMFNDGSIVIWDLEHNKRISSIKTVQENQDMKSKLMAFDPHHGSRLLVFFGKPAFSSIDIYDIGTAELVKRLNMCVLDIYLDTDTLITSIAFDPHNQGLLAVATSYPACIYIIDLDNGLRGCYKLLDPYAGKLQYHPEERNRVHFISESLADNAWHWLLMLPQLTFDAV